MAGPLVVVKLLDPIQSDISDSGKPKAPLRPRNQGEAWRCVFGRIDRIARGRHVLDCVGQRVVHHIGREPLDIFVDAVGKGTADIQARLGDLIAGRLNQTIVRFGRGINLVA